MVCESATCTATNILFVHRDSYVEEACIIKSPLIKSKAQSVRYDAVVFLSILIILIHCIQWLCTDSVLILLLIGLKIKLIMIFLTSY